MTPVLEAMAEMSAPTMNAKPVPRMTSRRPKRSDRAPAKPAPIIAPSSAIAAKRLSPFLDKWKALVMNNRALETTPVS